jgi:hypothetical protein
VDFTSSKPAAGLHQVSAARTLPLRLARSCYEWFLRLRLGRKQLANQSKAPGTVPVGKESKLANAHEAVWKDMLYVAPQELGGRERHEALLVSACIILPAESDLFPIKGDQSVIADGNAMSIAAQVAKDRCWTRHRLLDIDDPVFPAQRLKKSPESLGIFQRPGGAAETQLVSAIGTLQSVEKLAPKDPLQNTEWKKEAVPRSHPMTAIGCQATDWHETVEMGMEPSSRTIP